MGTKRKSKIGHVISTKMDKTVVVSVEMSRHHPLYKKTVHTMKKYKAHDANNEYREGDLVRIIETRPLSKDKRWRVSEVITRKGIAEVKPGEISPDLGLRID